MGIMVRSEDLVNDLGLSRTAISQIINGKGRYPEATRQRVLARARELGYTPHAGARAARLQRFETITLFNAAPFWQGIPHPGLYEGCMEGCAATGYRLLLETITAEGMPGLASRSNLLGQRNCDALLMNYHLPPPSDLVRLVDACDIPVLWLNVRLAQASLHPDDDGAARVVTRALIARGRRRIAWVDTNHDYLTPGGIAGAHYSVGARWGAVRETLAEAGLPRRQFTPGTLPYDERLGGGGGGGGGGAPAARRVIFKIFIIKK
jgi:LacI family transcriptional regulator